MKILFLCRGNVGRSVFGEYIYNKMTNSHNAFSAGTRLSGPEESLASLLSKTRFVIEAMAEEEIDVHTHVRKQVTQEMISDADIIIDMAEPETVPDFVKVHPQRLVWTIDDPKGTSLAEHIRIKNEVKEGVLDLIRSNKL